MKKLLIINLLLCTLILTPHLLYAEILCEGGDNFSDIECVNSKNGHLTEVKIMRMPSWDDNSSLTLIDICDRGVSNIPGKIVNIGGINLGLTQIETSENLEPVCYRRYCTTDRSSWGIFINGVYIPITASISLRVALSFYERQIKVRCEALE
jgi:hypothetical protein